MVAWQVRETLRQKNSQQIAHHLQIADAFFARWPNLFTWRRPLAGSTALVGMNVPSVTELAGKLATNAGILIQSAAMLGYDDQHMRVGFGRANFATALAQFEAYLPQL